MKNFASLLRIGRVLALVAPLVCAGRAENLSDALAPDPKIKIGALENGLTYYVRENAKPENRAELRLVVNAGSLMEDEGSTGVGPFLGAHGVQWDGEF